MPLPELSEVWLADLGNGKYQNPIIYADYSDPMWCASAMTLYDRVELNCVPGLPILHSQDLVNWTIIGYPIDRFPDEAVFRRGWCEPRQCSVGSVDTLPLTANSTYITATPTWDYS